VTFPHTGPGRGEAHAATSRRTTAARGTDRLLGGHSRTHGTIDLAAVLLGAGVRLFDHLANTPAVLGNPTVVAGVGVTHLRYPVHTATSSG
jgi:hypothetical protein